MKHNIKNERAWKTLKAELEDIESSEAQIIKLEHLKEAPKLSEGIENDDIWRIFVLNDPILEVIKTLAGKRVLLIHELMDLLPHMIHGIAGDSYDLYRCTDISVAIPQEMIFPNKNTFISADLVMVRDINFNKLTIPVHFGILGIFPVNRPSCIMVDHEQTYVNESDYVLMYSIIENIFKFAHENEYEHVVMNDVGCYLYDNPINMIIKFIMTAINKYPVKYIYFAVRNPTTDKDIKSLTYKNFLEFKKLRYDNEEGLY
jgi:hypothetical protein